MPYKIENLIKSYEDRIVLNLKSLSMDKGKIIGLLGPNGAGKTTLLDILSFLIRPSSGVVRYKEKIVDFNSVRIVKLRKKVVLVQQQPILFTTTVFNNVEFPLKLRKADKNKRRDIVEDLLRMVGMEGFSRARANSLSGGETQRVAIARALACSPEVILLDEPTTSIDVENRIIIERIIRDINRDKKITVIFTTHDMIQASRLADKIIFLFEGKVTDSIHENILSGKIVADGEGRKYFLFQDRLKVNIRSERTGPVRVSINPNAVVISDIRGENSVSGKLIQITDEKNRVRALVDIGIPLSVLVPKTTEKDLFLRVGEDVWLTFLPESIEVF